jgi:hypothetical protein
MILLNSSRGLAEVFALSSREAKFALRQLYLSLVNGLKVAALAGCAWFSASFESGGAFVRRRYLSRRGPYEN